MKYTLKDELKRIHSITYGNDILLNENFINKLNLITEQLFNKDYLIQQLTDSANNGGLKQQQLGYMTFNKGVEALQAGLTKLGYMLPKHGIDGLFGPETGNAVSKFSTDYLGNNTGASPNMLIKLGEILKTKLSGNTIQIPQTADSITPQSNEKFTNLNLSTSEGVSAYAKICQAYIDQRQPNPLGISGNMMAIAAKQAFDKTQNYVPPELALAQMVIEGGIGNGNLRSRPIRTQNPFNVGNTESRSKRFNSVQDAITRYYDLISTNYLGKGKSPENLLRNFTNLSGNRYASAEDYEGKMNSLVNNIHKISRDVT